jgi:hypothetical protein
MSLPQAALACAPERRLDTVGDEVEHRAAFHFDRRAAWWVRTNTGQW